MKLLSHQIYYHQRSIFGRYKYVTTSDHHYDLGMDAGTGEARSLKGHIIASWQNRRLTIYKDYAWDGMTGYPDRDGNKKVSLAHDLGYQLSVCPNTPFSKTMVDQWLYDLTDHWLEKRVTHWAVTHFGKFLWGFGDSDCYINIIQKRP